METLKQEHLPGWSINTQLSGLSLDGDGESLLLNVTWHKLDAHSMGSSLLSASEIRDFIGFMEKHPGNFPGSHYLGETASEGFKFRAGMLAGSQPARAHYVVLCKENSSVFPQQNNFAIRAVLRMEPSGSAVCYDLEYDLIGRIEVYRKL